MHKEQSTVPARAAMERVLQACEGNREIARSWWNSAGFSDQEPVDSELLTLTIGSIRDEFHLPYTDEEPDMPSLPDNAASLPKAVTTTNFKATYEKMLALRAEFPNAGREPTGIKGIDEELHISPGKLFVFAGREGSGKSAALLQMSAQIATRGPVLYFHTEMPAKDIIDRLVACNGHIEKWKLQEPSPATIETATKTATWLENNVALYLVDCSGWSHEKVIATAREYKNKFAADGKKLRALVVDNLHGLGYGGNAASKAGGTANFYGKITKDLIDAGKESDLNVPIFLAHHVNRTGSNSELTKARASGADLPSGGTESLGGSDQIGNDAHAVIIVSVDPNDPRDGADVDHEQVRADSAEFAGPSESFFTNAEDLPFRKATWQITKNRDGGPRFINLHFYGAQQRFVQTGETTAPLTVSVNTNTQRDDAFNARNLNLDF